MQSEEITNSSSFVEAETEDKTRKSQELSRDEEQRCDFCGRAFTAANSSLGGADRRKYCSKSCQSRASQGRIKARLAAPPSKRYAARLKFSSPLYFN